MEMIDWDWNYSTLIDPAFGERYLFEGKVFDRQGRRIDPESGRFWGLDQEEKKREILTLSSKLSEKTSIKNPEKLVKKGVVLPKRIAG